MNAALRRTVRIAICAVTLLAAALATACGDGDPQPRATPDLGTPRPLPTQAPPPGADERATLRGTLTLDGAPLETDFLGVRVIRDGLVAACQHGIPPVTGGAYQIGVVSDAEVRGCAAPGARIMLWAHVDGQFLFSQQTAAWPGSGGETRFDATFSGADPLGAGVPVTQFKGLLYAADGASLPGGTVVEAYVGETLCGVTSLRHGGETEGYYTLIVAGPDAIPACTEGAEIAFRVDGKPVAETTVHDLNRNDTDDREVNLTQR